MNNPLKESNNIVAIMVFAVTGARPYSSQECVLQELLTQEGREAMLYIDAQQSDDWEKYYKLEEENKKLQEKLQKALGALK